RAAFEVSEGGFVRRDHAGACAAFDAHVADGHAAVHRKGANGFAPVFGDVTVAAANADFSDDGEYQVLRSDALRALSIDENGQSAVSGGDGMVHDRESEIGAADFAAFGAKPGESLGGSAFVNEVAVNVDDRGLAGLLVDDVGVPDFLIERFRSHGVSIRILALLLGEANVRALKTGMIRDS